MGVYNTYAGIQLKAGSNEMKDYNMGDPVDLENGIYVGHDGFIVVQTGLLIAKHKTITTTWGDIVKPSEILDEYHPMKEAIREAEKQK